MAQQPPTKRGWTSGQRVILLIVGTAVTASAVAWWYQFQQGRRILRLWGPAAAYRIRLAPECEVWRLKPAGNLPGDLQIDQQPWSIVARQNISQTQGLVHARQALIQDASFDWNQPIPDTMHWQYALQFQDSRAPSDSTSQTVLVFDLDRAVVRDVEHPEHAARIQPIADGLRTFFEEKLRE
jgi:hypothetical protein